MADWKDAQLNRAKEILAFELTKMVHGEEEAQKAETAAKNIFVGGGDSVDMPTTTLVADQLTDDAIGLLRLLVAAGPCPSNSAARTLVQQGSVTLDGEKVTDPTATVSRQALEKGVVIRKGKKTFHKVVL